MPKVRDGQPMTMMDFIRGNDGPTADDPTGEQALAFARTFDPNAKLTTKHIEQGGGDYSGGVDTTVLDYDKSKLPKIPDGMTLDYGKYAGDEMQSAHRRTGTEGRVYDKNLGWIEPNSNWRDITDKENNAAQTASADWFGKIADKVVQPDHPLKSLAAIMGGAAIGGMGLSALEGAGANFGLNTALSGGKNLSDPMSYANLGFGALGNILPPEMMKTLGYIKTAAGWIKNPVGSAANMAIGYGTNKLFGK